MQEATEEAGEIGKIFDISPSEGTRTIIQRMLDAIENGGVTPRGLKDEREYGRFSAHSNFDYSYGDYQAEKYIIDALLEDFNEMYERGFVDTDMLMQRYGQYGTGGSGEGMSVNPEDVSNGVEKGASKANQSVVAALNTLIAAVNRSNSRPVNVTISPSARMGRMNKQSDMFLEYVIGG